MGIRYPVLFVLLLAGCATPGDAPDYRQVEAGQAAWPAPPEAARIRFLSAFSVPGDLGLKKSFLRSLGELFSGAAESGMVRPYAVSVVAGKIAVADPGAGVVHIFDTNRHSYRRLGRVGKQDLRSPVGVALAKDRLFVADSILNQVFVLDRRLRLRQTLAGFERPTGLAFDPTRQRLYVSDTLSHRIKVFDSAGKSLFSIGKRGIADGEFNFPSHLSIAGQRLLVNDTMNFRMQIFDLDGKHLLSFGQHGDGTGSFAQPKGVAFDADGHVYVADALSNTVQIFDHHGDFLLSFGVAGLATGEFRMPAGLAIDAGHIYVTDSFNQRVQVFAYIGDAEGDG